MVKFSGRLEKSISSMYGEEDLATFPIFQGGFINFGYWDHVPDKPTQDQRIQASRRLYEVVLDRLQMTSQDTILEVGCGRGHGCVLALGQYHPKEVWGLDCTAEQINRCKNEHKDQLKKGKLHFVMGNASAMPFPDQLFSKIFSVEALQHVSDLSTFVSEAFRVLKPGGKCILTTFFRQKNIALEDIAQWIQTVEKKIDYFHPIDKCLLQNQKAGFTHVTCQSIGKYVWKGFDVWGATVCPNDWGRNWLKVYQKGLIDYFIIECTKPTPPPGDAH